MMKKVKLVLLMTPLLCCIFFSLKAQDKNPKSMAAIIAEDEVFLKRNKTQPGIVVLPSGLQYKIIKAGTGPKPMKFSGVEINYTIKDFNGKILYSNGNTPWIHRPNKASFGMEEALKMMTVGSKWIIYMPNKLCLSKYENWAKGRSAMCTLELLSIK